MAIDGDTEIERERVEREREMISDDYTYKYIQIHILLDRCRQVDRQIDRGI